MNPLVADALGGILRTLFAWLSGYLVTAGIWTEESATMYVAGAVLGSLTLLWSLYQKYGSRLKIVTALASPAGETESEVEATIADNRAPSATTAKNDVPKLVSKAGRNL